MSLESLIKTNSLIQWIHKHLTSQVFRIWGLFVPTDESLVLFSSFSGKRFDESPRVIFEQMKKRSDCSCFKYVWAFEDPSLFGVEGATVVKQDSLAYFYTALRAGVWVTNVGIERGMSFKKRDTFFIRCCHGTAPKKCGNAAPGRKDFDFSNINLITTDGEFCKKLLCRDFNAKEANIRLWGSPGEDELFMDGPSLREGIRSSLGIAKGEIAILYMPTWRDDAMAPQSLDTLPFHPDKWAEGLSFDVALLLRGHSKMQRYTIRTNAHVIDCTEYPSVNDLYRAADILISDYSGAFANYSILGKPMLCYAYDYEKYESTRGLYFDIREFVTSFAIEDELISYIEHLPWEEEEKRAKEYFHTFAGYGGASADKCIDAIIANRKA